MVFHGSCAVAARVRTRRTGSAAADSGSHSVVRRQHSLRNGLVRARSQLLGAKQCTLARGVHFILHPCRAAAWRGPGPQPKLMAGLCARPPTLNIQ
jgi:hypothetical protein